ncbi:MAG: hypothetical protein ACRD5I_08895 [Candidatus Acidiferrales bacterium]
MQYRARYALALLALLLGLPAAAHAYVDPGAGSMFLQLLLGGSAGLLVVFRIFRGRIYRFFGRRKNDPDK